MTEAEYPYLGSVDDALTYQDSELDFSVEDIKTLMAIKTGDDITSIEMGKTWKDDHEMCVNLIVNGVKFAAMWIVPEFFADIVYAAKGASNGKDAVASYIDDMLKGVNINDVEKYSVQNS